jgi:hypothetical protein
MTQRTQMSSIKPGKYTLVVVGVVGLIVVLSILGSTSENQGGPVDETGALRPITIRTFACGSTARPLSFVERTVIPKESHARVQLVLERLHSDLLARAQLVVGEGVRTDDPLAAISHAWNVADTVRKRTIMNSLDGGFYTDDPIAAFVRFVDERNRLALSELDEIDPRLLSWCSATLALSHEL